MKKSILILFSRKRLLLIWQFNETEILNISIHFFYNYLYTFSFNLEKVKIKPSFEIMRIKNKDPKQEKLFSFSILKSFTVVTAE